MRQDGLRLAVDELADARANHPGRDEAEGATLKVNDARARVVDRAVPEAEPIAKLGEPTAAPHPRPEHWVDEATDDDAVDEEALVAPALSARAGNDGGRGVHERHHEQKQDDGGRVVSCTAQEEAGGAEQTPAMVTIHAVAHGEHVRQRGHATERRGAADGGAIHAAAHQREARHEEPEHAQGIDQEVHGHRVRGVLRTAQPRLHQCKPSLHEDDEEARDQHPHEVDREERAGRRLRHRVDRGGDLLGRHLLRVQLAVPRHRRGSGRALKCTRLVRNRIGGAGVGCPDDDRGAAGEYGEPPLPRMKHS